MIVMQMLVAAGQTGGDTLFDNRWLSGAALVAGAFVLAAGVTSAIAVAFHRERSIVNWGIILFGLLALTFITGEFLSPHS
jgi:hypothetical protein